MRMLLFALLLVACTGTAPRPMPLPLPVPVPDPAPLPATTSPDPAPAPRLPLDPGFSVPISSPPPELFACETDSDCTIECDIPGNCCGAPCGCRTAVNAAVLDALRKRPWAACPSPPDCPAMGCAYDPAFGARCDGGRCVATDGPGL